MPFSMKAISDQLLKLMNCTVSSLKVMFLWNLFASIHVVEKRVFGSFNMLKKTNIVLRFENDFD